MAQAGGDDMETEMVEAAHSGLGELACSARGIQDEGKIHRLKLAKRRGFRRVGFALSRQRWSAVKWG
jgi:hypothetical protein